MNGMGVLGRLIAQRWQKAKCEEFWAQDKASDSARAKTTRSNWRTSSKNGNHTAEDANEPIESFGRTSDNRIDSMASPAVGSVKPVAPPPSSEAVCFAAALPRKKQQRGPAKKQPADRQGATPDCKQQGRTLERLK